MNIKQAKQEIIDTVQAYLLKNEYDEYVIPRVHQRPVLLLGAPGIGKTQIMEQAARECGVALVAYTITHHTRQSAIGLPFISKKEYGGREYSATEYTMSEIVASIYDRMRETGLTEGILFIDELNCVSETLAPTMLQFLQCKTFGNHEIPKGWVIVAAGNPPEYNKSVRDFDVVTLDRVKKITVEPDYRVWKEYAFKEIFILQFFLIWNFEITVSIRWKQRLTANSLQRRVAGKICHESWKFMRSLTRISRQMWSDSISSMSGLQRNLQNIMNSIRNISRIIRSQKS